MNNYLEKACDAEFLNGWKYFVWKKIEIIQDFKKITIRKFKDKDKDSKEHKIRKKKDKVLGTKVYLIYLYTYIC